MTSVRDIFTLAILFVSLYFEVFLLITYIERRRMLKEDETRDVSSLRQGKGLAGVTIIVPCFNEEKTATKTIESLLALDYPKDLLRIIAVDDGSTDGTLASLQIFKDNPQIEIITKANGGKHTALNLGIAMTTTPFVGCLDADSYVEPDTLSKIMKRFKNEKVMAVVPSLHVHKAKSIIQKMQRTEYLIGVFIRAILAELNALYVTPGPFSIFRKSVFDKIGNYKPAHNTEDMEMAMRMQKFGLRIGSAHDAIVYTSSPRTVKSLYKQRVRWTSGFLHNLKDYRYMIFNAQYGHMGGFVLPMMLFSFAGIIFIIAFMGYDFARMIHEWVQHWNALGFRAFEWHWPSLSWYFMQTSPVALGSAVAFLAIITFVVLGWRLSRVSRPKANEVIYYVLFYSIIAPFWVIRSLAIVTSGGKAKWR